MKKLGAILSSAVIMIALLLPMSASALSGSGRLSGPSAVRVNNTFNVAFSVNADSDFYGIQGNLSYDSSQLQLVSVSGAKGGWTVNNSGNMITADDNSLSTHTKGSNTFFNIKFKVKSSAQVGQKISVKYNYFITDGSTQPSSAATFTSSIVAPLESNKPTAAKTTRKTDTKGTETSETTEKTTVKEGNPVALNSMSVKDFAISPKFNPDQKEYIVWLPYETENIDISALPVNESSKVEVEGGKNLKAGKANTVKVTCTAEDGKKQVYTIKAMRAPLNGVYASQTNAKSTPKDDTKPGTPMWLTIVLCVACALVGFIFALIISSIKRKRDLGPYDDYSDDMLGLDLFDHDEDTETSANKPKGSSNFDGIKFPETKQKNKAKKSNRVENEQNNKRMYIKPDANTFNGNGQSPNNRENTITVDSKPPVMPQPPKPIQPVQRPVQPQAPTQSSVQRPVQQQVSKQPPVHMPAQQQVSKQPPVHMPAQQQVSKQPPVQRPVQQQVKPPVQKPVQPPVQRPVQQQVPTQPPVQKPVQPVYEKPIQPQVKQAQPKVEKPVQPKTQIKSGASIEVGEKMNNIKPKSSASPKKSEAPKKEVEKMKLPYTAAGAPQPEQQLKKPVAPKRTKKLPRNPFELSADD